MGGVCVASVRFALWARVLRRQRFQFGDQVLALLGCDFPQPVAQGEQRAHGAERALLGGVVEVGQHGDTDHGAHEGGRHRDHLVGPVGVLGEQHHERDAGERREHHGGESPVLDEIHVGTSLWSLLGWKKGLDDDDEDAGEDDGGAGARF